MQVLQSIGQRLRDYMDNIDDLIKLFDKSNGNKDYTQRDLLKSIVSRMERFETKMDGIDDKLGATNRKLDNHITSLSERIASIETTISNFKFLIGPGFILAIIAVIIAILW